MKNRTQGVMLRVTSVILAAGLWCSAQAVTVNFDSLAAGVQPGNVLASSGVTFTTGNIPDAVAVGNIITLAGPIAQFEVFAQPTNAVSPPNFATALGVGLNDLLMSFTTPVTSVSVRTDHFSPETPEIVRLLALAPTGNPNEYTILAIAQGQDDAVSAPADTLSVSLGGTPFSFALFQTTTEAEGFDDLTFAPAATAAIPTSSAWGTFALAGLLGLWGLWRLRQVRRR